MNENRKVAYFSMEIGLHPDMPTYSGGLGILAGDTIRAAAIVDYKMPGMDGAALISRIRDLRPAIKTIMVTG